MRGYLGKNKGNSKFKSYSKKKKMTILSVAIVMVLFVISGISAFADNIQTDIGSSGEAAKWIQLNTCKAVDTSKTLAYVTNKENIPYVITIKEEKGLIFNKSSAYVWTPVILTQNQKDAFVRAVKNCVSKTVNTTVLSKDRVKNYYASLNNLNNEKDRWFTPTGSSLVTKVGETTVELSTTNNTLRVVDNSLNKNFKYVIYGSFKKTDSERYLSHGLTDATASDNVNPEDDNDICIPQPTDGGANTPSTKNHVAILDVGIHIPGAEFTKATNNNTATFIFAKKDKVVSLWTSCELTTEQKLSIVREIQKSVKTVSDTNINSVASDGDTTNFFCKDSEFAKMYKVTDNNGKLSLSATDEAKMEWYCGGIIEFRDKASKTTATLKDYRIEELKALQNNNNTEKNFVQINTAYLFNQNNTFDLTNSEENIPYIVVVNNGKVYIWTRTKLTDKQQESFLKVIDKTFNTIPLNGNATVINTAVNNKTYSFYHSAENFGTSTIENVFDIKLANQKTLSVATRSGVTLNWYVAGYYKLSATEVTTGVNIEDKRQPTVAPTQTPVNPPLQVTQTPVNPPVQVTQTPVNPPVQVTQTPVNPPVQVTQTPVNPPLQVTQTPVNPPVQATQTPVNPPVQVTQTPVNPTAVATQQPPVVETPQQTDTTLQSGNGGDNQQVTQESGNSNLKTNDSTPKTGDNANVIIYVILGILAVFGIGYFYILRKKVNE